MLARLAALLLLATLAPTLAAQEPRGLPMAAPARSSVPDPVDTPYPGTIALHIDATDTWRALFRAREDIPVAPGTRELTLLYPQWRPGNHAPSGSMAQLSELRFTAAGKPVRWRRDPLEPFAFHVALPEGTATLTAELTYAGALHPAQGQVLANPSLFDLQWDRLSLYPAGHYVRDIRVLASVTLPPGWNAASGLDGETVAGATRSYAETDYETLVDSPLFAGRNVRSWDLGDGVKLDLVADEPRELEASPQIIAAHQALVRETLALFGGRHFDHYDMLMALSDAFSQIGTEHQRSAEMQAGATTYRDGASPADLGVVPHEFVHSWNGKYKRPARLWTPDFRQPMQTDLLWVYEGQTQFWGMVLGVRSGLQSKDLVLGQLASSAAGYTAEPGRAWRSVEDTTADPVVAYHDSKIWPSLARTGGDYYREAALVWLEADQILRQRTGGRKGLDDFARAFFGGDERRQTTYELADVVAALNALAPYDWRHFFAMRIESPDQPPPLGGIEAAGYRLVFRDTPNAYDKAAMNDAASLSLTYSLGLSIDRAGVVTSVVWDSPAFAANIVPSAQIVSVDGHAYSAAAMRTAVAAARNGKEPIALVVRRGERVMNVPIDYHGGLRYPWLEPKSAGEQGLDRLLAPRTRRAA